jgi:putative oxidoreductase
MAAKQTLPRLFSSPFSKRGFTGKGKLENIGKVTEFFASLGIPLPTLNAYFIGSLECFGSLLLIIGLASQPLSLLIVISMSVAYLTADFEAVSNIFSDPDKFVKADPFPFLLTALIVLVFGPGRFSVDALLKWRARELAEENGSPTIRIERTQNTVTSRFEF